MAETGWPLIPREVLPAPVPRESRRSPAPPDPAGRPDAGRQLSFFGAETTEPSPADLAGLLAGPGRLERMGGTARVRVSVDAAWRVHVLVAELVSRGLVVSWHPLTRPPAPPVPESPPPAPPPAVEAPGHIDELDAVQDDDVSLPIGAGSAEDAPAEATEGGAPEDGAVEVPAAVFEVRTAYSIRLNALARAWPQASDRMFLGGPGLRLWVAAAGRPAEDGYALGVDPAAPPGVAAAALRRAGLDGSLSDHGLHYLITGRRRLERLAELVGQRPAAAPADLWPGGAAA